MDQNLKEKTLEKITAAENILIAASLTSEFDGLAAALGLYLSLIKTGKKVVVVAKPPTIGDAQKLYGIDQIGKKSNSSNLVVVVDNAVNTVDKVTYYLEKNKLKIVVHPLPGTKDLIPEQVSIEKGSIKAGLIFTLGFKSADELQTEISHEQNIDSNIWTIAIGKEELSQKFAQSHLSNPQATCLSEIVATLIQELALPVDEDIAYNLYRGISEATDQFSPVKSTPPVFQVASWLIKFGAGKASLSQNKEKPIQSTPPDTFTQSTADFPSSVSQKTQPTEEDWFKPPKIYKGSNSFDTEY